jgi:hypothetical protein
MGQWWQLRLLTRWKGRRLEGNKLTRGRAENYGTYDARQFSDTAKKVVQESNLNFCLSKEQRMTTYVKLL